MAERNIWESLVGVWGRRATLRATFPAGSGGWELLRKQEGLITFVYLGSPLLCSAALSFCLFMKIIRSDRRRYAANMSWNIPSTELAEGWRSERRPAADVSVTVYSRLMNLSEEAGRPPTLLRLPPFSFLSDTCPSHPSAGSHMTAAAAAPPYLSSSVSPADKLH